MELGFLLTLILVASRRSLRSSTMRDGLRPWRPPALETKKRKQSSGPRSQPPPPAKKRKLASGPTAGLKKPAGRSMPAGAGLSDLPGEHRLAPPYEARCTHSNPLPTCSAIGASPSPPQVQAINPNEQEGAEGVEPYFHLEEIEAQSGGEDGTGDPMELFLVPPNPSRTRNRGKRLAADGSGRAAQSPRTNEAPEQSPETCRGRKSQAKKPHELEKLAKGLNLKFGLSLQSLKDKTGKTLRSGKVCDKAYSKRKRVQQETLNMKGCSVAQITAANKLQSKDSGQKEVLSSFSVNLVPSPPVSLASNNHSAPDMDSDELQHTDTSVDENQGHGSFTPRFSCREYSIIVRKALTKDDVGTSGGIVLPKKEAEGNLPTLLKSEYEILTMVDFKLPATTWDFLYSFRSRRTDGRIYRIRVTGQFVKSHGLKKGDTFIIYQSQESGKFLVRGEKSTQQRATLPCLECQKQAASSRKCKFAERA